MSKLRPDAFERCYVCDRLVGASGERDHFPVSDSLGGTETMVICSPCHDLKDRLPMDGWAPGVAYSLLSGLWGKATTEERLVLAKMFHVANQGLSFMTKIAPYGMTQAERDVMAACLELQKAGWDWATIGVELKRRNLVLPKSKSKS